MDSTKWFGVQLTSAGCNVLHNPYCKTINGKNNLVNVDFLHLRVEETAAIAA